MKKPAILAACVLIGVAVLLAGAAFLVPVRSSVSSQPNTPALTVSLAQPALRLWPETVPASGWLKPWQEAIIASEASGLRVTDILVDVGSIVTRGQTLVQLSQDSILADIRKQEAEVENAKASLAKAKADADRARQLSPLGAMSAKEAGQYLTAAQTAKATLDSAQATLDSEMIRLAQTTITAADYGLITARSVELGEVVAAGTELFHLVRQQRVEWQAEVSARYLSRIAAGMSVAINGPDNNVLHGTVRLVGPSVSTGTGRAIVYVTLPADCHPRTGLYWTGSIELQTSPALAVPETAIVFRDGLNYVFTVDQDKRARRVRVETGRRNNGEVEIVSGLGQFAWVVTSGGAFLSNDDLVKIAGGGW